MRKASCLALLISCLFTPTSHAVDDATIAWAISTRSLSLNTERIGDRFYLLAGSHQFRTLWTRDFSMAVGGALMAGAEKAVHDSLDFLIAHQREDGLIPRTADNQPIETRVILGTLGIRLPFKAPLKPWYETEYKVIAIDANALVPWAASRYVLATHDREAASRWFPDVERALRFFENGYMVDGLIGNQPPYSDWEDSIKRTGRVAMTNVLYILALRGVADWALFLGQPAKALHYAARAADVTTRFREYFWMPEQRALRNFEGDDHLSADANLLAVAHQIVSPEEARAIMRTLRSSPLWHPMPGRVTTPNYPRSLKGRNVKLIGLADYHDSLYWLWITATAAMAERAVGNCDGYHAIMNQLSHRIVTDNTVHEVLNLKKGVLKPVKRLLYRAERPFTWSSGMYLEAAAHGCR